MVRGGSGQVSMEYLLITGFAFLILIPIIIIAYSESAKFSDDVSSAQIQKVAGELTNGINAVYYAGTPTKKTLKVYFPDRINSININGDVLVFTMQGGGGVYEYAIYPAANMTGSLGTFSGMHIITLEATANDLVNITDG